MRLRKTLQTLRWGFLAPSVVITLVVLLPLAIVISHLFTGSGKGSEIADLTWGAEDVSNSVIIALSTALLALVWGVSTAWVVSRYEFSGRKFFEWALVLPLTIPSYIMAFTYAGMFSYTGSIPSTLRSWLGEETGKALYFDILTLPWLVLLLSLVLFPYVYLAARASFSLQSASQIEAARSLGTGERALFFRIALPLARPALVGGALLVIMEVLNDYGAMAYFGIRTFTTSIFRTWQYDLHAALQLAAWLLITVFLFTLLEKFLRGKASYSSGWRTTPAARMRIHGWKKFLLIKICSIPIFLGFVVPVVQLLFWLFRKFNKVDWSSFAVLSYNSFLLALIATGIIVFAAVMISYNKTLHHGGGQKFLTRISTLGYSAPGAVIAVGVLVMAGAIDRWISVSLFGKPGLILTGSIFLLVMAYLVRFLAVGFQTVDGAMEKKGKIITEAACSLGASPFRVFLKAELPILRTSILAAAILVFVDVLKELPLTLILRPFNFETLAVSSYKYAKVMESVEDAAPAAILIIFMGLIPVFLLNKLIK